jgi:hypothetical protein
MIRDAPVSALRLERAICGKGTVLALAAKASAELAVSSEVAAALARAWRAEFRRISFCFLKHWSSVCPFLKQYPQVAPGVVGGLTVGFGAED